MPSVTTASPSTAPSTPAAPSTSPSALQTLVPVPPTFSVTPTTPLPTAPAPTTPSPPPEPTPDQPVPDPLVMPGTNHNAAASDHAHDTSTVRAWMRDPDLAPGPMVFLTFDDGPNQETTPRVLDVLREAGVPATFFILGSAISGAPDVLERTVAEGHAVALHSFTHDYSKLYPGREANPARVGQEFDMSMEAVREVLGPNYATTAWRYPGGHGSWQAMAAADEVLADRGANWIDWNALTGDAEPKKRRPTTVEAMVEMATLPIVEDQKVVVMLAHDSPGKDLTVAALPQIIDAYQAAGYEFGVIS